MAGLTVENVWDRIRKSTHVGQQLRSWSVDKGDGSAAFKVLAVEPDRLKIQLDSTRAVRTLSKRMFERLAPVWEDYLAGRLQRQALKPLSHHTSYALAILRKADV